MTPCRRLSVYARALGLAQARYIDMTFVNNKKAIFGTQHVRDYEDLVQVVPTRHAT